MAKLTVSPRYRFGRARMRDAIKAMLREAPDVLRLFGRLMTDARVSALDRGLVAAVIAYVISPIDVIPDFLGLIGVVDDLFLVGLSLDRLLSRAPARVVHEHWGGSRQGLAGLAAELQALGDLLPEPMRRVLLGRMESPEFGGEARETLFADTRGEDLEERLDDSGWGAGRPHRQARERVRARRDENDLDAHEDEYADEQGSMRSDERISGYRDRL